MTSATAAWGAGCKTCPVTVCQTWPQIEMRPDYRVRGNESRAKSSLEPVWLLGIRIFQQDLDRLAVLSHCCHDVAFFS